MPKKAQELSLLDRVPGSSLLPSASSILPAVLHPSVILEALVAQLEKRTIKKPEAESQLQSLSAELTVVRIYSWTPVQRAKTYFLLLKLQTFGFAASKTVLAAVSLNPDLSNAEVRTWWGKAKQLLGVAEPVH